MSKQILVVGPDGFLASKVVSLLLHDKDNVIVALGRKPLQNQSTPKFHAYYFTAIDVKTNHPEIATIFLLGSFIPYGRLDSPDSRLIESNIKLVADIALLFPDAKIVFSSSVSVYGRPLSLPITIDSPFNQPGLYGLTKLAGEAVVKNHPHHAIIRFSSIVGSGMRATGFLGKVCEDAKNGVINIKGDGRREQNYISVNDAAMMCLHAAAKKENVIVLGVAESSISNMEVAYIVQKLSGARIQHYDDDDSESFIYIAETTYELLGYRPVYSIESSIRDLLNQ